MRAWRSAKDKPVTLQGAFDLADAILSLKPGDAKTSPPGAAKTAGKPAGSEQGASE